MKYRSVFAHILSGGAGALVGSVVMFYTGVIDKHESLLYWATGTTLIIGAGVFYGLTRHKWEDL